MFNKYFINILLTYNINSIQMHHFDCRIYNKNLHAYSAKVCKFFEDTAYRLECSMIVKRIFTIKLFE